MNEANNVLTIKTVQIQPIRNMITAIKDVLTDATITYTNSGLKIINFDKTHTILVNVILHAEKFELYDCKPEKHIERSFRWNSEKMSIGSLILQEKFVEQSMKKSLLPVHNPGAKLKCPGYWKVWS